MHDLRLGTNVTIAPTMSAYTADAVYGSRRTSGHGGSPCWSGFTFGAEETIPYALCLLGRRIWPRARYPWLLAAAVAETCVSATGFGCWSGGTLALPPAAPVGFLLVRGLRASSCVRAGCAARGSVLFPS